MIKKIKVTRQIEEELVEDVLCNQCGESCLPPTCHTYDEPCTFEKIKNRFYGLINAEISGGFDSYGPKTGLSDGINYSFSLCEKCLKKMFDNFKHPVKKEHWL
jgi:hypothetical protein